jgi:hypothetical protein
MFCTFLFPIIPAFGVDQGIANAMPTLTTLKRNGFRLSTHPKLAEIPDSS